GAERRPRRRAVAAGLARPAVLVEVDERADPVAREQRVEVEDALDVGVVVDAAPRLDALPDEADARDGEALVGEHPGVGLAELRADERRDLLDDVDAVDDHDTALVVDEPAALA